MPRSSRALWLGLGSAMTILLIVLLAMKLPAFQSSKSAVTPTNPPAQPAATAPSQPAATTPTDNSAPPPAATTPAENNPAESAAEKARKARAAEEKKEQDAAAAKAQSEALAKAQAEAEAAAKLFDEQENRFIHMSARAAAMKTSYETLKNQQAAAGYSPNQDLTIAVATMDQFMSRADAALSSHDGATAKKYMDMAEPQIEKLERKFGR